jgi:hypothetical protein
MATPLVDVAAIVARPAGGWHRGDDPSRSARHGSFVAPARRSLTQSGAGGDTVPQGQDALERGRAAADARDWQRTFELLHPFADSPGADVGVLDSTAEAAWWLGRLDECVALRERAYTLLEAAGDRPGAARMAMLLSDNQLFRGRRAVASGWLHRAKRQLEGVPECLQHGCLLLRDGELAHGAGELAAAAERFAAAIDIGTR